MKETKVGSNPQVSRLSRRDALRLAGGAAALAGAGQWRIAWARQATPVVGERPTLRVGVAVTTETIDPHADFRNQRGLVIYSIFDGLLRRDFLASDPPGSGGGITAGLASNWQRVDDLTLELTLRDDIIFHDGSPLTAEDVKFSFDLVLTKMAEDYPLANNTLGEIAGVEIVDPRTVRVSTAAPDPILEKRLATYASWIIPQHAFEEAGIEGFGQKPIGTGPYKVVEYRPDEALIMEAHDAYWGGEPPAAGIEFRIVPEVAARIAALVSGGVDLIASVPPDQLVALQETPGIEVRSIPLINIRTIAFNTRHPVMADVRFRQGLKLAIDRQLIIDSLWNGQAVLPRGQQFASYGDLYNAERPLSAYDLDQATQLIAESDYDGSPIALWIPADYYTLGEEVTQAVVEMWRAAGVNAEVQLMTIATFYDDTERKTAVSGSDNNEFADPDAWWLRWGEGSTIAEHFWTPANPRFDELGREARASLDADFRNQAYQEMLDIWEEEAPGTVLYTPIENYGLRAGIDWQPYAFYFLDFRDDNLRFD